MGGRFRPWLTLEVDADSRCVLKFHLGLAPPSGEITDHPLAKPYYKGLVERVFRTLEQRLTYMLPGRIRSNNQELGEYDPIKAAPITYEQLLEALRICIHDLNNAHHRELANTPLSAWVRGTEKNSIEPPPSDEERP